MAGWDVRLRRANIARNVAEAVRLSPSGNDDNAPRGPQLTVTVPVGRETERSDRPVASVPVRGTDTPAVAPRHRQLQPWSVRWALANGGSLVTA